MVFAKAQESIAVRATSFAEFIDKLPKIHNVFVIAMIACISGMLFGFDISSMSAFIGQTVYERYFGNPAASPDMQGFITAVMSLGSFFGSIASSFISEPFGRRPSLLICSFFWITGAAIQCSSQNKVQLILGRLISGFGVGFGSSVAPVYGSELAPRKVRGTVVGIFQFSVTLGILIMFFICYGLGKIEGTASFRIAWGIQIIPGLILFFGIFFIPESPRWLAKQGQWDKAETIVAQIQAKGNREDPNVLIEISEIKEQIMIDEYTKNFPFTRLFNKKYFKRTFTAVFAQIWQQLTGMNVMMYYITDIFAQAGYSGDQNLLSGAIQYILNCVMTIPALYLIDKVGRRWVLMVGAAGMFTFQFGVAGILATYARLNDDGSFQIPGDQGAAAKGLIACCYLFVVSFACSWGVCIWLYCAEIWGDNASRQKGAAISTAANWIFNFAIAMFTPHAFSSIFWKTYVIYGSFCGVMFLHVFFGFPETRGFRLEEIDQMWDDKVLPWKSASWKPNVAVVTDQQIADKMSVQHQEGGLLEQNSSEEASDKSQV